MEPTFRDRDLLVVVRADEIALGDVITLERPEQPGITYVKRVARIEEGKSSYSLWVESDNPEGVGSEKWGLIPESSVTGKVIFRAPFRWL